MDILSVQKMLNRLGITPQLAEDGIRGAHTVSAVVKFQARAGLVVDGIVGPITWAALEKAVASGAPLGSHKLAGICIRGLVGGVFSRGMYALAARLSAIPGCQFSSTMQGVLIYDNLDANYQALRTLAKDGSPIAVFGHSMGGDEVWKAANMLQHAGLNLAFAISVDPTCWGNNGGESGQWIVPSNVQRAGNYRQRFYPGGGTIVRSQSFRGDIFEKTMTVSHVEIDDSGTVLDDIVHRVKTFVQSGVS